MAILTAHDICVRIDKKIILDGVTMEIPTGKITAIIGPNGSGKSTLLKTLTRSLSAWRGEVQFAGRSITALSPRQLAQQLAVLPQSPQAPPDLTVKNLVEYGRFPHRHWWQSMSFGDEDVVEWAIVQTGLAALAERLLSTLSGGERQRAWIAMALAQKPQVLLLDEPTTYLDICHQTEVLELVKALNADKGLTVGMVLHDINQAARYADHVIVMQGGRVYQAGPPQDIIDRALLREVFQVEAEILYDAAARPFFAVQSLTKPQIIG